MVGNKDKNKNKNQPAQPVSKPVAKPVAAPSNTPSADQKKEAKNWYKNSTSDEKEAERQNPGQRKFAEKTQQSADASKNAANATNPIATYQSDRDKHRAEVKSYNAARNKAYQDAKTAGKSDEEARNAQKAVKQSDYIHSYRKASQADQDLANARAAQKSTEQKKLTNPDEVASRNAERKNEMINRLKDSKRYQQSGFEGRHKLNELRDNGHSVKAAVQKGINTVGGFFRGLVDKKQPATDSVDMLCYIHSEAGEYSDIYNQFMSLSDEEFDATVESMSIDELEKLDYIFAIESIATTINDITDAINTNDMDSEDFVAEACAVFSEYGLDDLFCAITECAN